MSQNDNSSLYYYLFVKIMLMFILPGYIMLTYFVSEECGPLKARGYSMDASFFNDT